MFLLATVGTTTVMPNGKMDPVRWVCLFCFSFFFLGLHTLMSVRSVLLPDFVGMNINNNFCNF